MLRPRRPTDATQVTPITPTSPTRSLSPESPPDSPSGRTYPVAVVTAANKQIRKTCKGDETVLGLDPDTLVSALSLTVPSDTSPVNVHVDFNPPVRADQVRATFKHGSNGWFLGFGKDHPRWPKVINPSTSITILARGVADPVSPSPLDTDADADADALAQLAATPVHWGITAYGPSGDRIDGQNHADTPLARLSHRSPGPFPMAWDLALAPHFPPSQPLPIAVIPAINGPEWVVGWGEVFFRPDADTTALAGVPWGVDLQVKVGIDGVKALVDDGAEPAETHEAAMEAAWGPPGGCGCGDDHCHDGGDEEAVHEHGHEDIRKEAEPEATVTTAPLEPIAKMAPAPFADNLISLKFTSSGRKYEHTTDAEELEEALTADEVVAKVHLKVGGPKPVEFDVVLDPPLPAEQVRFTYLKGPEGWMLAMGEPPTGAIANATKTVRLFAQGLAAPTLAVPASEAAKAELKKMGLGRVSIYVGAEGQGYVHAGPGSISASASGGFDPRDKGIDPLRAQLSRCAGSYPLAFDVVYAPPIAWEDNLLKTTTHTNSHQWSFLYGKDARDGPGAGAGEDKVGADWEWPIKIKVKVGARGVLSAAAEDQKRMKGGCCGHDHGEGHGHGHEHGHGHGHKHDHGNGHTHDHPPPPEDDDDEAPQLVPADEPVV